MSRYMYRYAEFHYAECHNAEYRSAECLDLFIVILYVIMPSVIILSFVAPLGGCLKTSYDHLKIIFIGGGGGGEHLYDYMIRHSFL
jgi:hypothetical protein